MLFIHTWEKVLSGEKTATSRIVKLGDFSATQIGLPTGDLAEFNRRFAPFSKWDVNIHGSNSRAKWSIGVDYAVQPGRGKKAVGRIRITGIERYDVRTITAERARQEGFSDTYDFLCTWVSMHDKRIELSTPAYPDSDLYQLFAWAGRKNIVTHDWYEVEAFLAARPAAFYDAWFLTFELLKGGE